MVDLPYNTMQTQAWNINWVNDLSFVQMIIRMYVLHHIYL